MNRNLLALFTVGAMEGLNHYRELRDWSNRKTFKNIKHKRGRSKRK